MDVETYVRNKQRNSDKISNLPDSLLCRILSYLSTKESVSTSVLSKRWEKLWLQVPVMDLDYRKFLDVNVFESFLDRFLDPVNKQYLERFKLIYDFNDNSRFKSWINAVISHRICHLDVNNDFRKRVFGHMPMSIYSCERLVKLNLHRVVLDHPKFVLLPCVKIMNLSIVKYNGDSTLETLISSCHALEELSITPDPYNSLKAMYIRSRSLKSFKLEYQQLGTTNNVLEIDAPRLEYMSLRDHHIENFIIHSTGPSPMVYINVIFNIHRGEIDPNNYSKITMMSKFFTGLSTVSHMIISCYALQVIRRYCKVGTLPQFSNLTTLDVYFQDKLWEMLPSFLESFPNLKSFILGFYYPPKREDIDLYFMPQCFLSSLEFVHLKSKDVVYKQKEGRSLAVTASKMRLAKYFLENCATLKQFTVTRRSFHKIINEIKLIPRSSTICEVVMKSY